jgi:hypothetical protein
MLVVSAAILMRGPFEQKYAFLLQTFQGPPAGQTSANVSANPLPAVAVAVAFAAEFDLPYLCNIFSMVRVLFLS